jgi:hypothetical protein
MEVGVGLFNYCGSSIVPLDCYVFCLIYLIQGVDIFMYGSLYPLLESDYE